MSHQPKQPARSSFNLRNQSWVNTALVCLIPWAKLQRSSFTHTDTHLEHSRHGRSGLISCTCCGGASLSQHSVRNITEEGSEPRASVCMEMSGFHPGSQVLLDTGGLKKTSAKRNSMGTGGRQILAFYSDTKCSGLQWKQICSRLPEKLLR